MQANPLNVYLLSQWALIATLELQQSSVTVQRAGSVLLYLATSYTPTSFSVSLAPPGLFCFCFEKEFHIAQKSWLLTLFSEGLALETPHPPSSPFWMQDWRRRVSQIVRLVSETVRTVLLLWRLLSESDYFSRALTFFFMCPKSWAPEVLFIALSLTSIGLTS